MPNRFEVTRKSIFWSYAGTIFSMASNFLLLPIVFHFLSPKEIGYWYLILSINSLITLFDFGFDPTFARNIAYVWSGAKTLKSHGIEKKRSHADVNYHLLASMIHAARVIYMILAIVAIVLVGFFGTMYMNAVVFSKLPDVEYKVTWLVFCFSLFLNLYFGYFSALLRGSGEIDSVNKAQVFSRILQIFLTFVGFLIYPSILSPVIGLMMYGIIFRTICSRFFWRDDEVRNHRKELKSPMNWHEIKEVFLFIWPNTWRDGLVSMSNYVTSQGMSLIAGAFLPLSVTGVYSVGVQFASAIGTASSAINGAYNPILQSNFVKRDFDSIRDKTSKAVAAYIWIFAIATVGTLLVIFPLLKLIKPESVPTLQVFLPLILYYFFYQQHSAHAGYIANANIIPYAKAFLISAGVNLVGLWLGLKLTSGNIYFLLFFPIVVQALYNNWRWPMYYYKMIGSTLLTSIKRGTIAWGKTFVNFFKSDSKI
ncbi:lipopolysaccharide biosynthesis protein [Lacticaseibacillus chiayiensis]|uniref:lipopolysaccharide biosynthesis protein n=1 Tax=Lacticaseibacillus chiayiensis TaxID=2100821 RepID=UPI0010125752|nr:lipopolysaccharide biosynthesis protein [Lacticaseibacillus chiayiensis]RXT55711.1 histidine kinase [Lacticaseibacillus chiayiensis]